MTVGDSCGPFLIVVDCWFNEIIQDKKLSPINNKFAISMVNRFEDGNWRLESFLDYLWDNVARTALNANERELFKGRPASLLKNAAKNLRITQNDETGGEIAEILLYAIMNDYYGALPVVPKIFYKQNANDYAKGADSVHIVLEENGRFSLWLGEAKFYDSLESARLDAIVESVHTTLSTEKIRKENHIILGLNKDEIKNCGVPDVVFSEMERLLNPDCSIDALKPVLHVPILILHECKVTAKADCLSLEYKESIRESFINTVNSYFKKQINRCADIYMYSSIKFHLIVIPVPNKIEIVNRFKLTAKTHRGELM